MAIDITETFQVRAPIELVWRFLLDPGQVAPCMPGAVLDEVVDERTFHGTVKIKVGAITTRYKGTVHLTTVDEAARHIEMSAEGRETGGGTAKGSMVADMRTLPDGRTEVVAKASVDLTGKIMQVGRGMIQGVSHQLFLQFVSAVQAHLEPLAAQAAGAAPVAASGAQGVGAESGAVAPDVVLPPPLPPPQVEQQAIRIVPLVLGVVWEAIKRFLRDVAQGLRGIGSASVFYALLGVVVGSVLPVLGKWVSPPKPAPAFEVVERRPGEDFYRIDVVNDGDRQTVVTGIALCSARHAWAIYDPTPRLFGRRRETLDAAKPIDVATYAGYVEKAQAGWVVLCNPNEGIALRTTDGGPRRVAPDDAITLTVRAPDEIESIATSIGRPGIGMASGNTWCAITVSFLDGSEISRIYPCKTREPETGLAPEGAATDREGAPPSAP